VSHTLHILGFWGLSFVTLAAALVAVSIFYQVVGSDLSLDSLRKEAAVAGFASLFEGLGLWVVISLLQGGARVLLFPGVVVFFIYRLTHLTDWSGYEPGVIILFQLVIAYCGVMLFSGHFAAALWAVVIFAAGLALVASLVRSLG
jgi:hypothetical protein